MVNGIIEETTEPNSLEVGVEAADSDLTLQEVNSILAANKASGQSEDVFENSDPTNTSNDSGVFSTSDRPARMRQVSTSLMSHPILDDQLQDFHQHKLKEGFDPLDVRYNLYAMVVSLMIY